MQISENVPKPIKQLYKQYKNKIKKSFKSYEFLFKCVKSVYTFSRTFQLHTFIRQGTYYSPNDSLRNHIF